MANGFFLREEKAQLLPGLPGAEDGSEYLVFCMMCTSDPSYGIFLLFCCWIIIVLSTFEQLMVSPVVPQMSLPQLGARPARLERMLASSVAREERFRPRSFSTANTGACLIDYGRKVRLMLVSFHRLIFLTLFSLVPTSSHRSCTYCFWSVDTFAVTWLWFTFFVISSPFHQQLVLVLVLERTLCTGCVMSIIPCFVCARTTSPWHWTSLTGFYQPWRYVEETPMLAVFAKVCYNTSVFLQLYDVYIGTNKNLSRVFVVLVVLDGSVHWFLSVCSSTLAKLAGNTLLRWAGLLGYLGIRFSVGCHLFSVLRILSCYAIESVRCCSLADLSVPFCHFFFVCCCLSRFSRSMCSALLLQAFWWLQKSHKNQR